MDWEGESLGEGDAAVVVAERLIFIVVVADAETDTCVSEMWRDFVGEPEGLDVGPVRVRSNVCVLVFIPDTVITLVEVLVFWSEGVVDPVGVKHTSVATAYDLIIAAV